MSARPIALFALLLTVPSGCSRPAPDATPSPTIAPAPRPASSLPMPSTPASARAPTIASASDPARAPASDPARASALPPASDPARAVASAPDPAFTSATAGEAHRSTVPRLEADVLLLPHLAILREHFGAGAKGPFDVQRIDLADGRTAVLVSHPDESDPIVLAFDRDQLLWSKLRPTAGILPPVKHLTVLPRPDGGAVIFAWVTSLHMVAARMWADDGNPFGDFELFAPDACDALSAAYGPGQGWVVACTSRQGTRAQRLREDGAVAWGHEGVALGSASASGPATIAFDSPSSLVLLEQVAAVGGDRLLAFRYDPDAQPLWAAPADLGTDAGASGHGQSASPDRRVVARVMSDGVVRVDRPLGIVGKGAARATEISAAGEVRFSPP